MLSHLSFAVADLDRAGHFYDAALGALGVVRVWSTADAIGYGFPGGSDKFALKLRDGPVLAPGSGFHLAFQAPDRTAVHAFHVAALAAGGQDDGGPGPRERYGPDYYAAFVRDPDGYRIEAKSLT